MLPPLSLHRLAVGLPGDAGSARAASRRWLAAVTLTGIRSGSACFGYPGRAGWSRIRQRYRPCLRSRTSLLQRDAAAHEPVRSDSATLPLLRPVRRFIRSPLQDWPGTT
jgi:hypothetical protein